ncbi:MAG: NADH-quinone oxidoreductase subunit NuoB [Candidatus Sumerlaeia bacterium]
MLDSIIERLKQGRQTIAWPKQPPELPDRFRGRLIVDPELCLEGCEVCVKTCPVGALERPTAAAPRVDLGKCLFCADCAEACPVGAIGHSRDWRLAARKREHFILSPDEALPLAEALDEQSRRLFGRSLKLREVSAGGCNACEADTNVLGTIGYDLGRFGIQFVASPRHADGILITGPVTKNMELALKKTYDAVPAPKIVIAVGACAISGGPFAGNEEIVGGADPVVPVDLYIPGCPPHPITILDGLVRLLGRIQ